MDRVLVIVLLAATCLLGLAPQTPRVAAALSPLQRAFETPPPLPPTPSPRPPRPVRVYTFTPVADTYVRNGSYANSSYGQQATLVVKFGSSGYQRQAFLRFDLRQVAGYRRSATLNLAVTSLPNGAPAIVQVCAVADDTWPEVLKWNTQPSCGLVIATITVPHPGWYTLNVSRFVSDALTTPGDGVVSFELRQPSGNRNVVIASSEASAQQPFLMIRGAQ